MDTELKKDWLVALRSGDFTQGTGRLFSDGCYCCLGVLAKVANLPMDNEGKLKCDAHTSWSMIPSGLHILSPTIQQQLIKMNDGVKDFDQIADWIEENITENL